jgi:hypothetical protein
MNEGESVVVKDVSGGHSAQLRLRLMRLFLKKEGCHAQETCLCDRARTATDTTRSDAGYSHDCHQVRVLRYARLLPGRRFV